MSPEQLAEQKRSASHAHAARRDTSDTRTVDIAVVGLGYVGLPLSILAASRGFHVTGFDIDEVKVAQLERREADFLSDTEQALFRDAEDLSITSDPSYLKRADVIIVCVPTPVRKDHTPDLVPMQSAAKTIGTHIRRGTLVIIESTVNPGVCEEVVLPLIEKQSGLHRGEFLFAHCPERVNPGDRSWSVRTIPRVVGGLNEESARRASALYRSLIDAEIFVMNSLKEAEAVKMVENSFRDINIAFANELAMAFDRAGIDIINVIRGASTKPFGFMPHYPGCGVGGHCIPVDPYYLIRYGHRNGFEHRILMTARAINNGMPLYTVRILKDALDQRDIPLRGATIALLGLSYKRDVPDTRESPAEKIREILQRRGATVHSFDPYVLGESSSRSLELALTGASAAVIATDHEMFRSLTPRLFERHGVAVVIDGRNCLDKQHFRGSSITYRGIGRR